MEMKTTLTLHISNSRTQGGFIGTREGDQAGNSWPEAQAQPRPYGRENAALLGSHVQRLLQRAVLFVPCQVEVSVSWFDSDKISSLRSMATW